MYFVLYSLTSDNPGGGGGGGGRMCAKGTEPARTFSPIVEYERAIYSSLVL